MTSGAPVWLAATTEAPSAVARRLRESRENADGPVRWLYLGRDYGRLKDWETELGAGFERIAYGRRLQELAHNWRSAYVEWIAAMGERHASLEWWSSAIAERNTTGPSLYHSVCYAGIALEHSRDSQTPLLIVAESAAVLGTLNDDADLQGRVRRIRSWRTPPFAVGWVVRFCYRWAYYCADAVAAQFEAWVTRRGRPGLPLTSSRPRVLLHSCIDESYFGSDGAASDRYFPGLAGHLDRLGFDVVTLPWLCNLKRSRRRAFVWFRRNPQRFLIPEDYYRIRDYLWAAGVVLRQVRLPAGAHKFQGLECTRLVREARLQQAEDPSRGRFVRYFRLIERCAAMGMRFNVFIDMFENLASEKPPVMAFQRWMPEVTTVGYQHYLSAYPLLLSFFTAPTESAIVPHPDVIVCGSALGFQQLTEAGFPARRLRIGPTLKYQYLLARTSKTAASSAAVLAVIPMETAAAGEFLTKVLAAFGGEPTPVVWLKLHPMMSSELFTSCLRGRTLPPHITVVSGTMTEWVDRAGCVVVMAGSAALEVALNGVPVVVVGRDTDFDFNPLGWFKQFPTASSEPDEIRLRVREELIGTSSRKQELQAWALGMLAKAVTPVSDEVLGAFVRPRTTSVDAAAGSPC